MQTLTKRSAGVLLFAGLVTFVLSARAEEVLLNFDNSPANTAPADCSIALTGGGGPVAWVIKDDPTAPSGSNVLAQTSADKTNDRFPLCIYEKLSAADVEVAVTFKEVAGKVDQAAGLVARFQNQNNYYITRANALEDNVRLYKVVHGKRMGFAGVNVRVASGTWHSLKLVVQDTHFQVFFDEKLVFEANDTTFKDAGKVGLWTKADSVTYFDNLSIRSEDTR
jgi:hypothetical protein